MTIRLQTSPTKDEGMFTDIIASFSLSSTALVTQKAALLGTATCPVARYVRWVLIGPASVWDATFRIYVAQVCPFAHE